MKIKRLKFKQMLPKAVSAFLVFWLSGVLILVCCGSDFLIASASNVVVEEEMSCPMKKGHDCCKKGNESNKVSETEKDSATCCIFKRGKTLSGDLQNNHQIKQSPAVTEKLQTPKPVYFTKQTYKSPKIYHSIIRNRGSTFLENCVFRI